MPSTFAFGASRRRLSAALAFTLLLALAASVFAREPNANDDGAMRDRWFYVSYKLDSDEGAADVVALLERAGKVDLNGMLWSAPWDSADEWSQDALARFEKIKTAAEKANVEIIPILWSIGYGTMTGRDPNLAEGLRVEGLPLVARNGRAVFEESSVDAPNADCEAWDGNALKNLPGFQDQPGKVSFRDQETKREGDSALRFENLDSDPHGHGRVMWELKLEPERVYRASIWLKASKFIGRSVLQAYAMDGRQLSVANASAKADPDGTVSYDWKRAQVSFRVPKDGKVRIYAGVWDGKTGKVWVDDLKIESLGFVNPLQRPGTPIEVFNADRSTRYEQGKDWIMPEFRVAPWKTDAPSQALVLPEGSRIADGERLVVDYYYPQLVGAPQIGTCMSEPKLYEYFEKSAAAVVKLLNPQKWFLSMDEIRCAGTCKACKERGISLAAILADCIAKQREIIKKARPDADVYIWSDMLDPNHNAHADYYACEGDYSGVWDLVPKDLIVSCWWYEMREKSMAFFSERGFKTQGAAYYDTDDLEGCADWFELCKRTPGCVGIMYTTWQKKYELLEGFGKLVAPQNDR